MRRPPSSESTSKMADGASSSNTARRYNLLAAAVEMRRHAHGRSSAQAMFRLEAILLVFELILQKSDRLQVRPTPSSIPGWFRKAVGMRIPTLFIFAIAIALSIFVTRASAQDPAVVNSNTIRVKFENDRVRVLEATLPPGVKEQVHSHPAYVIYVLEGGRYRNYASDGKITEGELKTGEVLYREPLTHAAENIGEKPLHMILVELKSDTGKSARP